MEERVREKPRRRERDRIGELCGLMSERKGPKRKRDCGLREDVIKL